MATLSPILKQATPVVVDDALGSVATLQVVQHDHLVDNARVRGDELRADLVQIAQRFPQIGNVRGLGLMQGVEFSAADGTPDPATAAAVQQAAITENLLTLTCGPDGNVVRLIPALVVTAEEIAAGVARFDAALATVLGDTAPASLAQVS